MIFHDSVAFDNSPSARSPRQEFAFCSDRHKLLAGLLRTLDARSYDFVAPTPATHKRVVARSGRQIARNLVDVLGWSLPVAPGLLDFSIERALRDAGVLMARSDQLLQPQLRVSRVQSQLFWHSAYPTDAQFSVFLGPDSSRFAQLILANMQSSTNRILDYGAGSGVGGIIAAGHADGALLTIADINPEALFLASINAEHAGVHFQTLLATRPQDIAEQFDLMVTHPPFMIDTQQRAYRDGGDLYGARLSLEWTLAGAALLAPGGRFIMHTGVSIVGGEDLLQAALRGRLPAGRSLKYRELDADIFGEELDLPAYAEVDRIAAVAVIVDCIAE